MTHAARAHRLLDQQAAQAAGDPPGHSVVARRNRGRDARSLSGKPTVTLAELWERQSQAGRTYYSGFLGRTRVMLLSAGEREHNGEMIKVWNLVVAEQEQKR